VPINDSAKFGILISIARLEHPEKNLPVKPNFTTFERSIEVRFVAPVKPPVRFTKPN
jgi:hypothetical protein